MTGDSEELDLSGRKRQWSCHKAIESAIASHFLIKIASFSLRLVTVMNFSFGIYLLVFLSVMKQTWHLSRVWALVPMTLKKLAKCRVRLDIGSTETY